MTDDSGILGNLPRSRPGRRSDRRDTQPAGTARSVGVGATRSSGGSAGGPRDGLARPADAGEPHGTPSVPVTAIVALPRNPNARDS